MLKGGDVGVRLFDKLPKTDTLFTNLSWQLAFVPTGHIFEGKTNLVPVYQLFASSPMVSRSPVVASQIKTPTWFVSYEDAQQWQIQAGDKLTISQRGRSWTLPVALVDYLASGCVGYVQGLVPLVTHLPTAIKKDEQAAIFVPECFSQLNTQKQPLPLFYPIHHTAVEVSS